MASEIRVNQIQNRSGLSTVTFSDTGAIVSGIVTANNFNGAVTGNVTGNLSGDIVGTRTLGTGVTVTAAGVVSATTYYGSGANLTSLPVQATIANNADNKIITGGSGVNLNAESLAYVASDGDLWIGHVPTTHYDNRKAFIHQPLAGETAYLSITGPQGAGIVFGDSVGQNTGNYESIIWHNNSDDSLKLTTDNGNKGIRIENGGDVEVIDGNVKFASGHGIDFGATGGPAEGSGASELFDDYEEGSFTPVWKFDPTNATSVTYNIQNGKYVKIGGVVFIRIELQVSNKGSLPSGAGWAQIDGLPYACSEYSAVSIGIYQHFNNVQPGIAHVGTSEQVYIAYDPSLSSNTSSYDLQHTNFTNNSRINISGTYYAV